MENGRKTRVHSGTAITGILIVFMETQRLEPGETARLAMQ